jgi:Zn finger protein HypA/HybF involved in hydrogenase expression
LSLPERLEFTVTFPTDSGFYGRQCNDPKCGKYFKVHMDDIKEQMHCPYCGNEFPNDQLWTEEQLDYIDDAIAHEVLPRAEKELIDTLARAFQGPGPIRFQPGRQSTPPQPEPPKERQVDTELVCASCRTRFQVYGIFGYCPGCRAENLALYDANLAVIRQEVASSETPDRALRHAYGDLVSAFEIFCRKEATGMSIEQGRFQNLDHTRRLFRDVADVDIMEGLTDKQKRVLKRVFQKRHIYEHNEGIVNETYVKEIPEDAPLLGRKAPLSLGELEEAACALRLVLSRLVDAR